MTTTYRLLRVRDANGCEVNAPSGNISGSATIIIKALPSILSFSAPPPVCEYTPATFRVTAGGDDITFQWYVDEGAGFTAVSDNGTYVGSSTSSLEIINTIRTLDGNKYHVMVSGCGRDTISADGLLTVYISPEITLQPSDTTVCLGGDAALTADGTGTQIDWQWYVNKGAGFVMVADDPNFSGATTNTLKITNALFTFNNWVFRAKVTGKCAVPVYTNFARLTVINPPVVTVQPLPRSICEGGYTSFLANGNGYTSLQWQLFDGGSWVDLHDDVVYSGTNAGQLAVFNPPVSLNGKLFRMALQGICSAVYTNAVALTVNANPVVSFPAPLYACGGTPVVIDGNPQGGSGVYPSSRWTGDVGPLSSTSVQAPVFTSQLQGDFYLNYSVTDSKGCSANGDLVVKVDYPSAQFNRDEGSGCNPLTVSFTKDTAGITKFWWDFDDGSPIDSVNPNPVHQFINTSPTAIGFYTVKLRVQSPSGCFDTYNSMITVYPKTDASFTPGALIICSGNAIDFLAPQGASKYYWDFGDGVAGYSSFSTSHLYTNLTTAPEVHQVKLVVSSFYNCTDVKTVDITVMPVPVAQFSADPPSQIFDPAGNTVTFTNETNAGTWMYLWNFGDGSTSSDESPVHLYKTAGDLTVSLFVGNSTCSDSVKHTISISPPPPVANFDSIPPGCQPLHVTFNNTSLYADIPGTTFRWEFGDGNISILKNPEYTYVEPGFYRAKLTVTGPGGTSSKSHFVEIWITPIAYFNISPDKVYANDKKVRCFNESDNATRYLWEFGDGDTTSVEAPFHIYHAEGVYDITLTAYTDKGCSNKYVKSPGVTVIPPGQLRYATVFTPNMTGPIDLGGRLPDPGSPEMDQFFYPPIRQNVTEYKLQIFDRWGVLIFECHDIRISWNGYYHQKLCPQGVYVWYLEGKYENGQPFRQVGDITLLHGQ